MEKKETKTKKMGRPKKDIVKKTFESLCRLQCTLEEIASHFDCSDTTISRWCKTTYNKTFEEVFKEKSKSGFVSLRRAQFALAQKNVGMAIWLGKQYLNQRELNDQILSSEKIEILNDVPLPKKEENE